jgi:Tol biopolymer transport system component
MRRLAAPLLVLIAASCATKPAWVALPDNPDEPHLRNVRQMTFGGENAEAYWSWDGTKLVLQVTGRNGAACDQIFVMDEDGNREHLVSTGRGRTTCAFFLPGDRQIVYASTHHRAPECPTPAKADPGVYAWPIFDYDIFKADADGSNLVQLTDTPAYDAECTVAPDGTIVFTSARTGDLEIYTMRPDGSDVKQLTHAVGYDGGPFFSLDGKKIVYRANHPTDEKDVAKYRDLLARNLVQPTKMDLWIMDADGSNQHQVTHLPGASFGPFLRRAGEKIMFASNWEAPRGPEFELYRVNEDGSGIERITNSPSFDGFPMFSPDGTKLVWCSNRHGSQPHETNVFVADWVENP